MLGFCVAPSAHIAGLVIPVWLFPAQTIGLPFECEVRVLQKQRPCHTFLSICINMVRHRLSLSHLQALLSTWFVGIASAQE